MGSIVPFQDLNLLPDPSSVSSAPITPKIEPKSEPYDEPIASLPPYQHSQQTPHQQQQQQTQLTPFPDSTPPSSVINQSTPTDSSSAGGDHLYSEFYRISELFRTAFGNKYGANGECQVLDPDSRAIVPVPDNQLAPPPKPAASSGSKKYPQRSSELVRVSDLGVEDQRYFRDNVRRTRLIYDSLRVLSMAQDNNSDGRRMRADLAAASVMRNHGLWLNRDKRIVGSIPGIDIGDVFFYRMELVVVGLHGQPQAGIDYLTASQSSNGEPIATSVIVSGGYEDDEDAGDVIIYSGHGGQDKFNKQCAHQKLEGGNLAMERSMHYGIEVRVIRGIRYGGMIGSKVYVYDGLYRILECWFDVGKSGFGVYKYKLSRIEGQTEMGSALMRLAAGLRSQPLNMRPQGYLTLDLSMKKEVVPVLLFNDIDTCNDPLFYEYLARTVFPPYLVHQSVSGTGCECITGCRDDCFCVTKNGNEFPYDHNGILVRGKPVIFECGPYCKCPPNCRNRVSQKGLKHRLEVFRSREIGWAVRTLDLIQAGAFICEYAGVVLTRDQAQIFAMNGDSLVYPNRFPPKWAEWGDLSKIIPGFVRPSHPSLPPLDFAMDVSKMRNVACYMSHSSTPNVFVQYVLYDHNNISFPHLMLFALENIPPLKELSLDYGVADESCGKPLLLT